MEKLKKLSEEYQSAIEITPDHYFWKELSEGEKEQGKKFVIVGKLYNVVAVLLDTLARISYDFIIENRSKMKGTLRKGIFENSED